MFDQFRPPRRLSCLKTMGALLLGVALIAPTAATAQTYDLVIVGGRVVDGLGHPAYAADLGIKGDRVVRIAREGLKASDGVRSLDAKGMVVTPGFFDHHAHVSTEIADYPLAENFVRQGITTIIASLHSGPQPYPLKPFMDSLHAAPNIAFFSGHSFAREQVLGMENREPTPAELARMRKIVADSMRDGAIGVSTGLAYVPANYAKPEEVIALAKVAACWGGIYATHLRNEGAGVLDGVNETIRVAEEARLPAQINHHKVQGASQKGWSAETLTLIDAARARGRDITLDAYPYAASLSLSTVMFPSWALAGGPEAYKARIADPAQRKKLETEMMRILMVQRGGADLKRLQFSSILSDPAFVGKSLEDIVKARGLKGTPEDAVQVLIDLQAKGGFLAIYHVMDEEDVVRILKHPQTMFDSDGDVIGYDDGFLHPRSYGAFPRILGRYVREQKVLTLEEAIKRMTSMSADQIGQKQRGRIVEGAFADITVFDADRIIDTANFQHPHAFPLGIKHVVVNGVPVIQSGTMTGAMPGRPLTDRPRPQNVRPDPLTPGCPEKSN